MCEITDKAHHSIMLMTGARKKLCCPECGSDDFYSYITFDRSDTMYDDGYVEEGYMESRAPRNSEAISILASMR